MTVSEQLSQDDMIRLVEAGPLRSPQDVADFLDASPEERQLMLATYRAVGIAESPTAWEKFLAVGGTILAVANVVSAIAGAITGAYAVSQI